MLKKASDTFAFVWKSRVIATVGKVARWALVVTVLCLALIGFLHFTRGTDVNVVRFAGRAWYDTLLTAGVRVYEWQPTTLHAKTFVVDGVWFTVGSMNFDNRSMALNDEATLMVLDQTAGSTRTV